MIYFVFAFWLIMLGAGFVKQNNIQRMSLENTTGLRGIVILAVVLHHFAQYYSAGIGLHFANVLDQMGYLSVGVFFLLSGYGNSESAKRKNLNRKEIICITLKRIVQIYISFLLVYMIAIPELFIGKGDNTGMVTMLGQLLTLTLPGWTNWYLKIQIVLYLLFGISMLLISNRYCRMIGVSVVLIIYILVGRRMGLMNFWWNTVLCYPLGMFISEIGEWLNQLKTKIYMCVIVVVLCFFAVATVLKTRNNLFGVIASLCFGVVIYAINHFRPFYSRILEYLGTFSLELYMIHLVVLKYVLHLVQNPDLALFLILVISIPLSSCFHMLSKYICRLLYHK